MTNIIERFDKNRKHIRDYKYQIFGSVSSIDYDILVFMDEIPDSIEQSHQLVKTFNSWYGARFPEKPINCNLGVLNDDKTYLIWTFKGTTDEVNNSCYYTFDRHIENKINYIKNPINRDFELKLKRVARFILTFFSRVPELRTEIKEALRSDNFEKRISILSKIIFTHFQDYDFKEKDLPENIWKVIAFQLGITLQLYRGVEIYSKEGFISFYPDLENIILRKEITSQDLYFLQILFIEYLNLSKNLLENKKIKSLTEN